MPKASTPAKEKEHRLPAVKATPDVMAAKRVIEAHHRPKLGLSYSFAHVQRGLLLKEAKSIKEDGHSILD